MMTPVRRITLLLLLTAAIASATSPAAPPPPPVPGMVISHIPAKTRRYVGSPGIAVLRDGTYLAKHDEFGPGSTQKTSGVTHLFRSADRGATWTRLATLEDLFWSSIFLHRGVPYMIGTTAEYGDAVILRSDDQGRTWRRSILFADGGAYHTAPMPVAEHDGRLWRAMEDFQPKLGWGEGFRAFMLSAPVDADLMDPKSWTHSNRLAHNPTWLDGQFGGWLEGNAVVAPDGKIVNVLRVDSPLDDPEKAAIVRISGDGKTASFDPAGDFIDFPGGGKKFTIRWDDESKLYWSLANAIAAEDRGRPKPSLTRNTLALISSPDLRRWEVRQILLRHPDVAHHGFQYVDWQFENGDIIAACRTAFDDAHGGARRQHDANYLTFHRFENFRAPAR